MPPPHVKAVARPNDPFGTRFLYESFQVHLTRLPQYTTLIFAPRSEAHRPVPVLGRHGLDRLTVEIVPPRSRLSAGGALGPRPRKDLDLDLERGAHYRISAGGDLAPDADFHRQAAAFSAHPLE